MYHLSIQCRPHLHSLLGSKSFCTWLCSASKHIFFIVSTVFFWKDIGRLVWTNKCLYVIFLSCRYVRSKQDSRLFDFFDLSIEHLFKDSTPFDITFDARSLCLYYPSLDPSWLKSSQLVELASWLSFHAQNGRSVCGRIDHRPSRTCSCFVHNECR